MTIEELSKIWYALKTVFSEPEAKEIFEKLLQNIIL